MKMAVLEEVNKPLVISEYSTTELQFGQVLVKIISSGICGAQLQEIRGEKGAHFPRFMGHEGCGIVEEVGPGLTKVKPGDKVIMHWRKGEGIESPSPVYEKDGKRFTGGQVVTFGEYSICSENRLTAVPNHTPDDLACLLGCGLSTALGTIENEAQLMMGETVLIIGCGGLGLNLIRAAKMRLAGHVVAADTKRKFNVGCSAVFGEEWWCSIRPGMSKFDVVIDTTGNESAISAGLECLAPSGRFIMVGQPKPGVSVPINNARHLFDGDGCSIKATQGGQFNPTKDIPRYIKAWKAGLLNLDGIITHRYRLYRINEAIDLVRNGQAGRILITQ